MVEGEMTIERFKEILAAYGANPAMWPADERAGAEAIAATAEGRELADCAHELDLLLNETPAPVPASDAFMDRLASMEAPKSSSPVSSASQSTRSIAGLFGFNSFLPRAVGLASVCALGIVVGVSGAGRTATHTQVVDASQYLITNPVLMNEIKEID